MNIFLQTFFSPIFFHFTSRMQMAMFGVHFDSKNDRQRAFLCCALIKTIHLILKIITIFWMPSINEHWALEICSNFYYFMLQDFMLIPPSIAYTFFMYSLHKRFYSLNSVLRFSFHFAKIFYFYHLQNK